MTRDPVGRDSRVVLLDIEGTATPIAFVHDVLFPYARERLGTWLQHHAGSAEAREILGALEQEHAGDLVRDDGVPSWPDRADPVSAPAAVRYLEWLMDRDRKSPALKRLQGLIWDEGYDTGVLRGIVYPDVAAAFARWRQAERTIAIYSSGSERAQRRLFASVEDGDLSRFIAAFFDTRVGAKQEAASYARIAAELACRPAEILFVSDVTGELQAAGAAGCAVVLSMRPGNPPQPHADAFPRIHSFDEIA